MKIKTINQLITVFKDAANRHYQINGFGIGDNWEIGASKASMHPVLWINPVSAIMAESENNIGYKTFEIDFEIRVFDLVNKDESNENEVLSDTIDILKDIITEFKTHPYYTNSQLNIVNDINFEPFTEEYDEEVSGWVCELSLKSPLVSSWCGLPMAEIEGFSFPGNDCDGYNAVCDITYVDDVIGVYPIEVTTASGNTKIVSIDNAFLTGLTLTDGNGTTANGNSVDLGGALTQPITIISGSTTEILDIGGNLPNINLAQVRINSTSFQGNHLTAYDGTGAGQYINVNPGEFSSINTINSTSRTEINNNSSNAGLYNTSNKIVRLYLDSSGIPNGSGESFTLNGTTFTEGIDFIGQGNGTLDAATIAALDYSSVIYFDSVTDEGSGFVRFNFTLPAQISETLTDGNFLPFNWESSVQTDDTGVTIKVGDDDFYGTPGTILAIGDSQTIFTDNSAIPKGIQYGANYDATLVDDSLITKRYVDNAITGITDNNYYTTGATLIGNTVYFNRNDTLSAYTADLSSLSITLTDGNATTANGSSVDLGGPFTQLTTTLSGSNTETFNIGANVSGGNIDTTNINSSNLNIRNLTSYDGTGVGTNINLTSIGLFVDNNLDTNSSTFLGTFIGSSTLQYNDNRMLKLFLPNGGIANGSGQNIIVNGITFTEGVDFTGQGNKALDVATLLALDYSSVPNFVRVTYDGTGIFYEFIQNATLTTNITDAVITDKLYNEQLSVNNQGVFIQDNGTQLVLSNKNNKHYFKDDTLVPKGLQYDSDYSANYAPLSLITYKDLTGYTTDNFYTTGSTLVGNTIYFNRNDTLSAYTVDLSSIIPTDTNFANTDLTFTGNRTHDLNGNILSLTNGATEVFRINTFNDVIARGKGDSTNTHFGLNVLRSNSTGIQNTVFGQDITGISTGQVNAYFGYRTGRFNNGTGNSFFGGFAGLGLTTGNNNIIIGRSAAFSTNGGAEVTNLENSIVIGETARVLNSGDVNTIVIGRNGRGLGSNTVSIGNSDITRTQLRGRVEMDTTADGFLMPRLTTAQMNAVASPVTNTILYNTDLNGLYRYNGSAWVALAKGYGIIEVQNTLGEPTFYADLQTALNATSDIDTIHIHSDIQITSQISIPNRTSLTIEMNGHRIFYNTTSGDFNLFRFATSGGAGTDRIFSLNGGGTLEQVGTVVSATNAAVLHFFQGGTQRQLQIFAGTTTIKAENAFTIFNQASLRLIDGGIWYSTNGTISLNTAAAIIRNANIDIFTSTGQFSGTYDNCHLNTRSGAFWVGGAIINSRVTGAILLAGSNIGMIMCGGNDIIANNVIENGTGAVNWAINCYYAGSSGRISNNTINSTISGINLRYGSAYNNYIYAGSSRAITKTSLGAGYAIGNVCITNATNLEAMYTTGGAGIINNYCVSLNTANTAAAFRTDGANENIFNNTFIVSNAAAANVNRVGNVYYANNTLGQVGTGITGAGTNLMVNTPDAYGNIKIG